MDVHQIPGKMPPLWPDRSVVFFANLHSLFYGNAAQTEELRRVISGANTYGGRLFPIVNLLFPAGGNLLVLEKPPESALATYFSELQLQLPETVCVPKAREDHADLTRIVTSDLIRSHPAAWIDGFVTDTAIAEGARKIGKKTISTAAGSHRGNNKWLLHRHLEQSGLPVFDTIAAADAGELRKAVAAMGGRGYEHAVAKSQIGASGIGMAKLSTVNPKPEALVPEYFFHEGPCLVQGWIEPGRGGVESVHSPSVQMFLNDRAAYLYDLTEQVLSADSIHEGNISPPPLLEDRPNLRDELLRQAAIGAEWLHDQGYRGTASADFLVANRGQTADVFLVEINARVTGATYPALLARHFAENGCWMMRNIRFNQPKTADGLLQRFREHRTLFLRGSKSGGILPINFNRNADEAVNKGQFLFLAPTPSDCRVLFDNLENLFPNDIVYDRD